MHECSIVMEHALNNTQVHVVHFLEQTYVEYYLPRWVHLTRVHFQV